jgi:hypothetical protein
MTEKVQVQPTNRRNSIRLLEAADEIIFTAGNSIFAECHMLCRVPNIGHSAKSHFAKYRTRQREALGNEGFAECLALGKARHSAKGLLCQ